MINNVSNILKNFASNHPVLTILSLGTAVVGLVYAGKQFSWIRNPFASTQKTDAFAKNEIRHPDNADARNQAKDICYYVFATLSAAYACFNPVQLPAFIAGGVFALSIASVTNRYFGINPQKKPDETRPIFLGSHISTEYAEGIKHEYEKLAEELPPANYCFDFWATARKPIDYKALSSDLQSKPNYNSTLPVFFIVFRDSKKEDVDSDGDSSNKYDNEGVHCKAFFNVHPQEKKVVRGSGFEKNKAKLVQAYNDFTKKSFEV